MVRFDLEANAVEADGRLRITLVYNRDLFDEWRMDALASRYVALLQDVAERPAAPLVALGTPQGAARAAIIAASTGAPRELHPVSLAERLAASEASHPDAPAILDGRETLAYAELGARSNRLTRRLIAAGAGPETVVGILLTRSILTTVAIHAVIKAGAAWMPLDPDLPDARLEAMMNAARPLVVLTVDALKPRAGGP